jgi:hypothetical protein
MDRAENVNLDEIGISGSMARPDQHLGIFVRLCGGVKFRL